MLKYFTFFVFLFSFEVFFAQDLTATMKMPEVIAPGDNYVVDVTIVKGTINSYIKFTQKLPPHFKAVKKESNGGNFTFEDSIVRIVWLFPPASNEFSFSYEVKVPKDYAGTQKIGGKIYYFFNTNREVFSFDKREVAYGTVTGPSVSSAAVKEADSVKTVNSNKKDTVIKVVVVHDTIVSQTIATNAKSIAIDTVSKPTSTPVAVSKVIPAVDSIASSTIVVKEKEIVKMDTVPLSNVTKVNIVPVTKDSMITPTATIVKSSSIPIAADIKENKDIAPVPTIAPVPPKVSTPTENSNAAAAQNMSYCVQLGAFKEDVPLELANKFLKVSAKGIKNFKDNNGFTTFTVGNFKTHDDAIGLKNEMLEKGFQGAFIIAVPSTKTASTPSVNDNVNENKSPVTTNAKTAPVNTVEANKETKEISTGNPTAPVITKAETKAETSLIKREEVIISKPASSDVSSSSNKTYRVQIGAFKEEVPLGTANKFLKLAAKGVKNLKDDRGFTVYTVGDFINRDDAVKLKSELIEKGFQGAFIVPFENGKPVK